MTTYTIAELAAKSLREVGLYAPEESISAQDQADAEVKTNSLIGTLAAKGILITYGTSADDGDIPERWFIPLAQYIGLYLLPSFGGDFPTDAQISGAERVLRQLSARPPSGDVSKSVYY